MSEAIRTAADWSPSRFHYALFRLSAYLLVRSRAVREPGQDRRIFLAFHPWQSPVEAYALALAYGVMTCLYLLHAMHVVWHPPMALLFLLTIPAYLVAIVLVHLTMFASGVLLMVLRLAGVVTAPTNVGGQCLTHNALFMAIALWALTSQAWVRWIGIGWIALVGLNALAWVLMLVLRRDIDAVTRRLEA